MLGCLVTVAVCGSAIGAVEVSWDTATLSLDDQGRLVSFVDRATGTDHAVAGTPFCRLAAGGAPAAPESATQADDRISFVFPGGNRVTLRVTPGAGFCLFELESIDGPDAERVESIRLGELALEGLPTAHSAINAFSNERFRVALSATQVNVQASMVGRGGGGSNREGVTHRFTADAAGAPEGRQCARFAARSTRDSADGWAVRARSFPRPLDLTGLKAMRAWVEGDGGGEVLKIQLHSGGNGYRDDYLPIDFVGWREVTLDQPALDTLDPTRVRTLSFYYNALPANQEVSCRIDAVRAVIADGAGEREVMLEDFENADSELWDRRGAALRVGCSQDHGLRPAGFGIVAAPPAEFWAAMDRFEAAAGLPNPHPGGVWSKLSPWSKRSYLFITGLTEADVDEVIAWAHRGGLPMVLIGGDWSASHGHHEVNRKNWPDGLDSFQRAAERMHAAGLRIGLHFLAPAVYLNDAYATPVPDDRLVYGARAELAADIDERADFLPTREPPQGFPAEDGGYMGDGTFLRIGDELVHYRTVQSDPPGFVGCVRGANGTVAAPHPAGAPPRHVQRSYGYFLFDLDTSLADEVIGNVCRVANALRADMLYFDGSERLQGDHWYYNAKLQNLYYRGLDNKNTFLQGSSYSHYSWHLIGRTASADGHGDVKGYLDERTPSFAWYFANQMPLDIGWYYVYDPQVTLDQFEYILQRCVGFDSSISVQTNPANLRSHPEIGPIFDAVNLYERLRLSGQVPEEVKARLREPGREYRLLRDPLRLRRTQFGPWSPAFDAQGVPQAVELAPAAEGSRLGVQIRCGELARPGAAYTDPEAVTLETFDTLAPYLGDPNNQFEVFVIGEGKAGSTSEGVTQEMTLVDEGVDGGRCARYTAVSTRPDNAGWSSLGKRFDPPLDLSAHAGIGFWLRGDGHGGSFKLQLRCGPNAHDLYVPNTFTEWRYVQWTRPDKPSPHELDYSRIEYLIFYYNGLPGGQTVSCLIDDVKSLPRLDRPTLVNPELRVGDRRIVFPVELTKGERLVWFPGEAPVLIPAVAGERRVLVAPDPVALVGASAVTVAAAEPVTVNADWRWVQDLPEELSLPESALDTPLEPLP